MKKLAGMLVIVFFAIGCTGRDFVRPDHGTFKLGQTTYQQVIEKTGEPRATSSIFKNGVKINAISYSYSEASAMPFHRGVIPARAMSFQFHDDILIGQSFVSSFSSDSTDFDSSKIINIIKGKTHKNEVINLLGNPCSLYISPMIKEPFAIGYQYIAVIKGSSVPQRKTLFLSFDHNNIVSDIDYSSSNDR